MSNFSQHATQADSNISFVFDLMKMKDETENPKWKYPDWIVTGCFYSAVHIIEAEVFVMKTVFFVKDGKEYSSQNVNDSKDLQPTFRSQSLPTSNHYLRKQIISADSNGFSEEFVKAYMDLEEMSHRSRYDCYEKCGKDAKRSMKKLNIIIKEFNVRQNSSLKVFPE